MALTALSGGIATRVEAADFVISTPVFVTNGGNTVNGNDSITITESGSVSASTGLSASGDNNTLTNNGTITTPNSPGTNGMFPAGRNTTIINTGEITSGGDGIETYQNANVVNSGRITVLGTGADARGIHVLSNGRVVNSGVVSLTGSAGNAGIVGGSGSTIENSGTVSVVGTGVNGVSSGTSGQSITVTNSGKISSAQFNAVLMGTNGTLNLQGQSFLEGTINLGSNTTVNMTTGPSHSILWDFSTGSMNGGAPNFLGPGTVFYNSGTRQAATFDPTGLAGAVHQLGEIGSLISGLGKDRSGAVGGAADMAVSTRSAGVAGSGYWVGMLGGHAEYDPSTVSLGHKSQIGGVAAGYKWPAGSGQWSFDAMVGAISGEVEAQGQFAAAQNSDSEMYFAGLNAATTLDSLKVNLGVVFGLGTRDGTRTINSNTVSGGLATARHDTDTALMAINASLSHVMARSEGWSFSAGVAANYLHQKIDGYTETGTSGANATVGDQTIEVFQTNAELAASKRFGNGDLTMRIGYMSNQSVGDSSVAVTLLGQNSLVGIGDADHDALYLGAGYEAVLKDNTSLVFDGLAQIGGDGNSYRGSISFVTRF